MVLLVPHSVPPKDRDHDQGPRTKDKGQRTKDKGQRTKDQGPRTKDQLSQCLLIKNLEAIAARPGNNSETGDADLGGLEAAVLDATRDYHLARIRYESATGKHAPAPLPVSASTPKSSSK